jgi:lysozyme
MEQVEARFDADLRKFEEGVSRLVKVPLNDNMFAALVSFSYNLGLRTLENSTLLRLLNSKDFRGAADQMPRFCHSGGQVLSGLVRRRAAERDLFLTPVPRGR